ncbi:MAG: hypothetical protein GPOALKHO_001122 [Sodalis sp.]|nr:MAG: hypothetical protein GPOALKHO_001122 [Sodalis sp.]
MQELAEAEILVVDVAPLVINNITLHNILATIASCSPVLVGGLLSRITKTSRVFLDRIHRYNGSRYFSAHPTMGLKEYLTLLRRKLENSTPTSGRQKAISDIFTGMRLAHSVGATSCGATTRHWLISTMPVRPICPRSLDAAY